MNTGRSNERRTKGTRPRASITFPPELYKALEELAKRKKVSLAWVVRDAAEIYVASQSIAEGRLRGATS